LLVSFIVSRARAWCRLLPPNGAAPLRPPPAPRLAPSVHGARPTLSTAGGDPRDQRPAAPHDRRTGEPPAPRSRPNRGSADRRVASAIVLREESGRDRCAAG